MLDSPRSGWFVGAVSGELLHSGSAGTRMMKFVIPSNAEDAASIACWLLGAGHEMSGARGVVKEFIWHSQQSFMLQCIQIYSSVGRPIIVQATGEALL